MGAKGFSCAWGLCAAFSLLLSSGCQTGRGTNSLLLSPVSMPSATLQYQASLAGETLPVGRVVGKVGRFERESFVPAVGVTVQLDDSGTLARTDEAGCYGFERVNAGLHRVSVREDGFHAMQSAFLVTTLMGTGRVNLAMVPLDLWSDADGDVIYVAGLATDPRGVSLPRAVVRVVDSMTAVGNWMATADDHGFWWLALRGADRNAPVAGTANLSVYGRTPGGVQVEATTLKTFSVGTEPTHSMVAGTTAFAVPQELVWESTGARQGALRGEAMPRRRDEVVLRFRTADVVLEMLASSVEADGLTVTWPRAFEAPGSLEVLPLGLLPVRGDPPSVSLP